MHPASCILLLYHNSAIKTKSNFVFTYTTSGTASSMSIFSYATCIYVCSTCRWNLKRQGIVTTLALLENYFWILVNTLTPGFFCMGWSITILLTKVMTDITKCHICMEFMHFVLINTTVLFLQPWVLLNAYH